MNNESASKILHIPSNNKSLPSEWEWKRLDDICQMIVDCPHSTPKITSDGPLMVRTQDILSGIFRTENAAHVSEETYYERTRRAEPAFGDILYSREGTYFGNAAEVPPSIRVCLGQRMVLIKPDPNQSYFRFLRYWLNSSLLTAHVYGQRDGTVAERLNLPTIRGLPIPVPPLTEQFAIANVLSPLEAMIELNRQMSGTLEQMVRAIFNSWFVDFDPVRAKMEGHKPFGMDYQTAALFPDSLENSQLGKVPNGWNSIHLNEKATFIKGVSYKSEDLRESGVALVTLKSIDRGGGYKEEGLKPYSGEFKPEQRLQPGEVVVAHTDLTQAAEVLGRAARIRYNQNFHTLVASLDLVIVRPTDSDISNEFLYGLLSQEAFREHAYSYANGTTVLHLSARALPEYQFVLPPSPIIKKFTTLTRPIYQMMDQNVESSFILDAIRDALLPKLLSGEIRVKDAEKYAGTPL